MTTRGGQRRVLFRCGLTALFCAIAAAAPSAREFRTAEFNSLKVTIDSDWATRLAPGYVPVRFEIANLGDARVIDIVGQGSRSFRPPRPGSAATTVHQVVRLARGDRVRLTVSVPVFADTESFWFEIQEDNRTLERFTYQGFQSRAAPSNASALIVADPRSELGANSTALTRTLSGRPAGAASVFGFTRPTVGAVTTPSPSRVGPLLDFILDPARLPANWLGYTSLRAVVIGPVEWAQLADGQQSALLAWTACGGDLIFADGNLRQLIPSARGEAVADPDRTLARYFFGRVQVLPSAVLQSAGLARVLSASDPTRDARWALPANMAPDWGTIESRGFRLRIPGVNGVPARTFLLILAIFSLLIGPVNYWWLRRKRRQVLLVLTAPLISVAFIVLLAGYAIAGEGFGVQGRAMTFTMLDQASKQAVTRATVSLYAAGMTPAGGLRFARDEAIYPIGQDGAGTRDLLNLDLTDGQRFTRGVLQVRSATNFEEVAFRPARERLTFTNEPGGLIVTNGLDAAVSMLIYRDGDTVYRLNGPLASGGRQTMTPSPFDPAAVPSAGTMPSKFLDLVQHQPAGSYLAILDRSPFWESGVTSLVEKGSVHVVFGWPERQQ